MGTTSLVGDNEEKEMSPSCLLYHYKNNWAKEAWLLIKKSKGVEKLLLLREEKESFLPQTKARQSDIDVFGADQPPGNKMLSA